MKTVKVLAIVLVIGGLIAVGVYLSRITSVEVTWEAKWPSSLRAVGEASESIVPADGKTATQSDIAKAKERARWKAYYFAQLRLAEQVHKFQLDATTTVKDLALADQELKTKLQALTLAAAEVESESTVVVKGNVATARVVVEAPSDQLVSFKDALLAALRTGRVKLGIARAPEPPETAPAAANELATKEAGGESAAPATPPSGAVQTASTAGQPVPSRSGPAAPLTGSVVIVASGGSMLKATPSIYDAAGVDLGSALDLPPAKQIAGLPIADSVDSPELKDWVGSNPLQLRATVSGGNLFVERALDASEVTAFRSHLKKGKIALVLEKS